MNFFII